MVQNLLQHVQPEGGWYAILGIRGESVRQTLVATPEEVDQAIKSYLNQKRDVYFGVAKFATPDSRKRSNIHALRAVWLDLDCGVSKAEVDPVTGIPNGYLTQADALKALREFCRVVGLPKPTIVNSGRGLHVYWAFTSDLSLDEWEPIAKRLQQLCNAQALHVDQSVFEPARVLRVPNTLNFKDNPPAEVSIMCMADPVSVEEFSAILGVTPVLKLAPRRREMSALAKSMMSNVTSRFSKIMRRSANGDGCVQLLDSYVNRATLSEPRWFAALSVAKFCEDGATAVHKLSEGHPDYDPQTTEEKVQHIAGPHTCGEFDKVNPGVCKGCPFFGKIRSPITLGKDILKAKEEDNIVVVEGDDEEEETYTIPEYPFPYFRGENGGVYLKIPGEEDEPPLVYEHDIYVLKRMRDPVLGDVVVMRVHLPMDGVREFVVPNTHITDKNELRKTLSSQGVVGTAEQLSLLMAYIIRSIKEMQHERKVEEMRLQFGWADNDSKFIIGDREITKDGTYHSPPSNITSTIANHMQPKGTLEKWKEVFNLYGRPGMEPHAFGALTAFGSPLLKFTGQSGAIINVIHPKSGTGKTTILHMCNSVYGNPAKLCASWDDTQNAKIMRLGIMNNLPFTIDEITNTLPAEFSTLAYCMSQGRGKDRVKASANELRANLTTWQATSLASSNAAFYEKLSTLKSSPDGEMMRLFEYLVEFNNAIDTREAKNMFDHQLKENYGHAGDIYASWLVNNLEEALQILRRVQVKIDTELQLTQRERFWSAVAASNIAGGLIARQLGLIDWDMKALYKWVTAQILSLREDVRPPADNVAAIIGDYINKHMNGILVVDDALDTRTNMQKLPLMEPRSELAIRYEPDTKRMYFAVRQFRRYCVDFQISYKDTIEKLKAAGVLLDTGNKRMSKGMKMASTAVHCLIFDCTSKEFFDMDAMIGVETLKAEAPDVR
jgi:hypothetical protein